MSRKDVVFLLIVVGAGGYGVYGSMTETGLGGWLNYAQQAIFGEYLVKASVILAVGLVGVLAVLAEFAWNRVSGSQDGFQQSIGYRLLFGAMTTPATTPASQGKVLLQASVSEMRRELPCCGLVDARHVMELPHVYQFDFDLFQCGQCARYWVYAWREVGGWEETTTENAEKMQALANGELRAFMKEWARSSFN